MNVKKTVAGVMAGAMAVSAMVTTASALDADTSERALDATQFTLSYDLNSYVLNFTDTTVILKTNYRESEYLLSKVNKYTKTKTVTVDGKERVIDDTDYPDFVELGATLNGTSANYDLQSLELEATSVAQDANSTKNKVNELYFSKVILGKDITDLSNESYAIEDSAGLDFVTDAKGNRTGVKVAFNTKDQAKRGSFIVDGFLSSDSVKNQDILTFATYAAAKAAADRDPVYTEVEEVEPATDGEVTTTITWKGAKSGLEYESADLEAMVKAGDAEKTSSTTYRVAYKKKYFTLDNMVPLWTGGDWVIGLDDGTTKAAFKNNVSVNASIVVPIETDTDYDKVLDGNRYGTRTACENAIKEYKKDQEKDTVVIRSLPTLTVAQGSKLGDSAETYLKFGDFYLLNEAKATETVAGLADGKNSLEAVYKGIQAAIDAVKTENAGKGTYAVAKALYDEVGFADSLATAQTLARLEKTGAVTTTKSAAVSDVEAKRKEADNQLSAVIEVIDPEANAGGTHLGEDLAIAAATEDAPTTITLSEEYGSLTGDYGKGLDTGDDDVEEDDVPQGAVDKYLANGKNKKGVTAGAAVANVLGGAEEAEITYANAIDADFAALEWEYASLGEQINTDEATLAKAQADLVLIRNGQAPEDLERTENQQQAFILDLMAKIEKEKELQPKFRAAIDAYYDIFAASTETTKATYYNDHVFVDKATALNAADDLWLDWIGFSTAETVDPTTWKIAYDVYEDVVATTTTEEGEALSGRYYITDKDGKRKTTIKSNPTYSFETFTVTATYKVHISNWDNLSNYTGDTSKYTTFANGITNIAGNTIVNATIGTAYYDAYPMHTALATPGNVITSITSAKEWGNKYTSPLAVLNDVIANNEEVEFIFNSSKKYVDTNEFTNVATSNNNPLYRKNSDGTYDLTYYNTNGDLKVAKNVAAGDCRFNAAGAPISFKNPRRYVGYAAKPDTKVVAEAGRWYNEIFDQHLYQAGSFFDGTKYNADGTSEAERNGVYVTANGDGSSIAGDVYSVYGSTAYTSWNTNLFAGGIVVNSGWTMQLSDTTAFTWGKNTLTFKWSDINKNNYNGSGDTTVTNFHNVLTSMLMYTPVDWFWDSVDVVVGDAVVEDVSTTAGLDDDGETITDEPEEAEEAVEEDIFDEGPEEDIYEEEDEEDYYEEDDEDYEEEDDEYYEEEDDEYYEEEDDEYYEEEDDEDYEEEDIEPEVEEQVEVTPAAPATPAEVPSPRTGNSPIALAVIPVALAAAAVVAKKRG